MILNLEVEQVDVSALKVHPNNANRGDIAGVMHSIKTNGFWGALVVNRKTNHILAGNHRFLAVKNLGWKQVPVQWVEVDAETEKRILLADNRTTRQGRDDEKILGSLLADLIQTETGLVGTGYDAGDLDRIIATLTKEAYSPNMTPDLDVVDRAYSDSDVSKAGTGLENSVPTARELRPVMCIHCGKSFNID